MTVGVPRPRRLMMPVAPPTYAQFSTTMNPPIPAIGKAIMQAAKVAASSTRSR